MDGMSWYAFLLVGGLVILAAGGECLVKGAARLARSLGISALVVGLTVVAFGTSAPEIAVSVTAALQQQDDIAIANVVGSNISNILLVLGLAALTRPMKVARNVLRTDAPVMILVLGVFALFAQSSVSRGVGEITRGHGILFLGMLTGYLAWTYRTARQEPAAVDQEFEKGIERAGAPLANLLLVILGLAGLVYGAHLIVDGAVGIASALGVSKRIIGLTVIALGTSLPEVTTCVIAARHGQPDIAIGNVVGSNIFNVLAVIGIAASASPLGVNNQILFWDMPIMLGVAVLSFPIMRTGHLISRREGSTLLVLYAAYIIWTVSSGRV